MSDEWNLTQEHVFSLEKEYFPKANYLFKKYFPKTNRPDLVAELLRDTSLTVIEKIEEGISIENLAFYYAKVFENKIKNFAKNKSENINKNLDYDFLENTADKKSYLDEFEMKILVKEIIKKMSNEMRFIFEKKLLGYDYNEIQKFYKEEFDVNISLENLRQKFAREIKTLALELNPPQLDKVNKDQDLI